MALKVFLAATLRRFVSGYDAGMGIAVDMTPGSCVRDVATRLGIPEDEVRVIMVNGVATRWDARLGADDRVAFFPAVGGG